MIIFAIMTPQNILQHKNLRSTAFRKQVLNVFLDTEGALSQEQIASSIGDFDRITLYRTLKIFLEKGVLHEVVIPGEEGRFALCDLECSHHEQEHLHHHIHFQCTMCNTVTCIDLPEGIELKLPEHQVNQWSINAQGYCKTCQTR